ncbi:cytochrome P450 [Viridothelium virens]|uniref:Cytochrome P450 n=1 Tax=Viridothelium virens TaxID=1048519 RepID=A0A6A6GUQ8_VIRVR|nr:cytochrome P450 [Viridothelium virens]
MATLVYVLILLPIGWLLYNGYCLFRNFIKASALGLPCIVSPITPDNPLWIAFQTAFGAKLRYFPFDATSFTRHIRLGWEFHDRCQTHARLGDAWILVTPARNWLYVADNKAITEIFSRNRDFKRPVWMLEILNVFGPSISTAVGQDWQRQRKLTATPFNEQKSPLVWNEALDQARDMLNSWLSSTDNSGGFTTTPDDTRTLALHVLAYVAFQRSYPFQSVPKTGNSGTVVKDASSLTYRDSLAIILANVFMVMIFPLSAFSLPFGRSYMMKQLRDEQQLMKSGQPGTGTLVSNLVRASSETLPSESTNGGSAMKPLTESEILGNIFVFNFAGHDTTAISLAYGVLLITANPAVQDWIHEELQYYLRDDSISSYNEVFPKLKRCLAVLFETLRLYNPLPGVPKYTGEQPTHLDVHGKTYIIPPDTLVIPNLQAAHTDPRHWGSDSRTWRPQRWILRSNPGSVKLEDEEVFKPAKGTYFPWAEGTQNCPGRKFAQVEFVAVMVALLRDHLSEPVPRDGESLDDARGRTLAVVNDSNVELLLQMRNPRDIVVRWRKRKMNLS